MAAAGLLVEMERERWRRAGEATGAGIAAADMPRREKADSAEGVIRRVERMVAGSGEWRVEWGAGREGGSGADTADRSRLSATGFAVNLIDSTGAYSRVSVHLPKSLGGSR